MYKILEWIWPQQWEERLEGVKFSLNLVWWRRGSPCQSDMSSYNSFPRDQQWLFLPCAIQLAVPPLPQLPGSSRIILWLKFRNCRRSSTSKTISKLFHNVCASQKSFFLFVVLDACKSTLNPLWTWGGFNYKNTFFHSHISGLSLQPEQWGCPVAELILARLKQKEFLET